MMAGPAPDYLLLRQRKRLAHEVIHDGGTIREFARRADVSEAFASRYLKQRAPELHHALKQARNARALLPETVLRRLRVIKKSRTQREAAKTLNMSDNSISYFLKTYAPFGVDDALTDYEDAHGLPLLEDAA